MRVFFVLLVLLAAAPVSAHQETVAYSRMVIRDSGDVEYALKIPVEDLAETAGKSGHAQLNAPEVRGAQELFFQKFQPLVTMYSGSGACPVERAGIEVPEDDRLYGEIRFVFHCPPGTPVTLDYRVFFDVDPGHMGMLEIESPGGKSRAELIIERPRWEVDASGDGPPRARPLDGENVAEPAGRRPSADANPLDTRLVVTSAEKSGRNAELDASAIGRVSRLEKPAKGHGANSSWLVITLVVACVVGGLFTLRATRRPPQRP